MRPENPPAKTRIADGRADEWLPKRVRQWNEVEAVERAQGDTKSERTRAILHLSQDWGTKGGLTEIKNNSAEIMHGFTLEVPAHPGVNEASKAPVTIQLP